MIDIISNMNASISQRNAKLEAIEKKLLSGAIVREGNFTASFNNRQILKLESNRFIDCDTFCEKLDIESASQLVYFILHLQNNELIQINTD
jgi:hypothetical protein